MLLNLISGLIDAVSETGMEKKETMRALMAGVHDEVARAEELFNMVEDEKLIDSAIYKLKSLTAYQEYLLHIIREDELENTEGFIIEAVQANSKREEGLAMG